MGWWIMRRHSQISESLRFGICTLAATALLAGVAYACSGSGRHIPPAQPAVGEKDWYTSDHGHVFYYPYVEEIRIPDPIHENEPFDIVMEVSAEYRPRVLNGYPWNEFQGVNLEGSELRRDQFFIDDHFRDPRDGEIHEVLHLKNTIWDPPGVGPPVSEFIYHVPGLPAGEYEVVASTPDKREHGGVGGILLPEGFGRTDPFDPQFRYIYRTFTVLPAEEVGAE